MQEEKMAQCLEEFYAQETVFKAWILCGDEEEARALARELEGLHHTVVTVTEDDVDDEKMRFVEKLHDFETSARLLVISYPAWYQIREHVETRVLPQQNLLAFGRLDDSVQSFVLRWMKDARERGFLYPHAPSHVLCLYGEDDA